MFSKELNRLTLTGSIANNVFMRINGEYLGNDSSFIATLRALLIPRTSSETGLSMKFSRINWSISDLGHNSIYDLVRYGIARTLYTDHFYLVSLDSRSGAEGNTAIFNRFDQDFINHYDDQFVRMEDLEQFAAKRLRARFYIDETNRRVVILAESMNTRSYHFLQSIIPRYFPWFFDGKPLTDQEKALLASCLSKYAVDYERLIEEIAKTFDMRKHQINAVLGDFEKRAQQGRLNETRNRISSTREQILNIDHEYARLIRSLSELLEMETGIMTQINSPSEENELVEFFACNKNLIPLSSSGSVFDFVVTGCIENFDPDMFSSFAKNRNSHLFRDYTRGSDFSNPDDVALFLNAIFSDEPILQVKVCAYYSLDTRGVAATRSNFNYPDECANFVPNPHLQNHSCLGNHKRYIEEALRNGNVIGAVSQCISSAKSLNLGEGVTVRPFLRDLMSGTSQKCIILPDKSEVTPSEALVWLKQQNEETKAEEQKEE